MFGNSLQNKIDELERITPNVQEGWSFGIGEVERHDWRPVWALCGEIQNEFRGYKGFASREEHQEAWDRFQALRQEASRLADVEREKFAEQSARYKDEIIYEAKRTYWSMSADFFVGAFLGQTTVDEIKELQQRLKQAGQKLSEYKRLMTKVDKDVCFQKILECRESHDRFWEKYGEHRENRRETAKQKQVEWRSRVESNIRKNEAKISKAEGALGRARENISRNQEKIGKATNALERVRANISENESRLAEAYSDDFRDNVSGWIEEGEEKARDIEESIERIEGWISEDESRIQDIEASIERISSWISDDQDKLR